MKFCLVHTHWYNESNKKFVIHPIKLFKIIYKKIVSFLLHYITAKLTKIQWYYDKRTPVLIRQSDNYYRRLYSKIGGSQGSQCLWGTVGSGECCSSARVQVSQVIHADDLIDPANERRHFDVNAWYINSSAAKAPWDKSSKLVKPVVLTD